MQVTTFLLTLSLVAQGQTTPPLLKKPDDLYKIVVERALDRAQSDLLKSTDLWVDHSRWENPWVIESEHYQVRTTHGRFLAIEIARNLEFMYAEFEKLLGAAPPPTRKFPVWILPDIAAYNIYGNEVGAEHSSMYGSFFANAAPERPVATWADPNRVRLGMFVTHSAFHQYLETMYTRPVPLWISEGLASYFSLYWDWSYGSRELRRIMSSPAYIPLDRLMRDSIEAYVNSSHERFIQLGMLFNYLLNHREDTKTTDTAAPLRDFLRAYIRNQDTSTSRFARLSAADQAAIEKDFKAFDFGAQ